MTTTISFGDLYDGGQYRYPTRPGFALLTLAAPSHDSWKLSRCFLTEGKKATSSKEEVQGWQAGKALTDPDLDRRISDELASRKIKKEAKDERDRKMVSNQKEEDQLAARSYFASLSLGDTSPKNIRGVPFDAKKLLAAATVIKSDHNKPIFFFTKVKWKLREESKVLLYPSPDNRKDVLLMYFRMNDARKGGGFMGARPLVIRRSTTLGKSSVSECKDFGNAPLHKDVIKRVSLSACIVGGAGGVRSLDFVLALCLSLFVALAPPCLICHSLPLMPDPPVGAACPRSPYAPLDVSAQRYDGCGDQGNLPEYFCMCVPLGENKPRQLSTSDADAKVMRMRVRKSEDAEPFIRALLAAGERAAPSDLRMVQG